MSTSVIKKLLASSVKISSFILPTLFTTFLAPPLLGSEVFAKTSIPYTIKPIQTPNKYFTYSQLMQTEPSYTYEYRDMTIRTLQNVHTNTSEALLFDNVLINGFFRQSNKEQVKNLLVVMNRTQVDKINIHIENTDFTFNNVLITQHLNIYNRSSSNPIKTVSLDMETTKILGHVRIDAQNSTISISNSTLEGQVHFYRGTQQILIDSSKIAQLDMRYSQYNMEINNSTIGMYNYPANNPAMPTDDYLAINNSTIVGALFLMNGDNTLDANLMHINNFIKTLDGNDSIQLTETFVDNGSISLGSGNNRLAIRNSTITGEAISWSGLNNTETTVITVDNSTVPSFQTNSSSDFNSLIYIKSSLVNNQRGLSFFLHSESLLDIQNSTVSGDINYIDSGELFLNIQESSIQNIIAQDKTSTHVISIRDSSLAGDISVGASTIFIDNSSLNGIRLDTENAVTKNSSITITDSILTQDIWLDAGNDLLTFTNANIASLQKMNLSSGSTTLSLSNTTVNGEIAIAQGNIAIENSSIQDIFFTTVDNFTKNSSLSLTNTTLNGDIFFDEGINTISLNSMELSSLRLEQGTSSVYLENSTMTNTLLTGEQNDTIKLVMSEINTLNAGRGDNLIYITEASTIASDMILNEGQNTVHVTGSTIQGSIGEENNTNQNHIIVNNAHVLGNIFANVLTVENTLYIMNPLGSTTIEAAAINLGTTGVIHTNPGIRDDALYVRGVVTSNHSTSPAFILDSHLNQGEVDKLIFTGTVHAPNNHQLLVAFQNAQTITRTTSTVDHIPSVVIFNNNTNITMPTVSIGGSEYTFVQGEQDTHWDLRRTGQSAYNTLFASMEATNKYYTNMIWEALHSRSNNGLLEYSQDTIEKKEHNFKKNITLWMHGQGGVHSLKQKNYLDTKEALGIGVVGLDIKNIDIGKNLRIAVNLFGAYGQGIGEMTSSSNSSITIDSDMKAASVGASIALEMMQSYQYTFFTKIGIWGDLFENTVNYNDPTRVKQEDNWETYTVNGNIAAGVRINIHNFSIIPELAFLYSYIKGYKIDTSDSAVADFQGDHRFTTKATLLAGYNTEIGIKPYLRVGAEIPVSLIDKGGVYVGNTETKYMYDNAILGIAGAGVNYSIQLDTIDISTYIDFTSQIGAEEVSLMGNLGLRLGF